MDHGEHPRGLRKHHRPAEQSAQPRDIRLRRPLYDTADPDTLSQNAFRRSSDRSPDLAFQLHLAKMVSVRSRPRATAPLSEHGHGAEDPTLLSCSPPSPVAAWSATSNACKRIRPQAFRAHPRPTTS